MSSEVVTTLAFYIGIIACFVWRFVKNRRRKKRVLINIERWKEHIDKSSYIKKRLCAVDDLLLDLELQSMEQQNLRHKGIEIKWSDNVTGEIKTLNFLVNGESEASERLRSLANAIREETILKIVNHEYDSEIDQIIEQPTTGYQIHETGEEQQGS